jgi:hypothetical protein
VSDGPRRDKESLDDIMRLARDPVPKYSFSGPDVTDDSARESKELMNERSQRIDDRKTTEMLEALAFGGEIRSMPLDYDYCRKYSRAGSYVLCKARNYHNRCPGHSGAREQLVTPPRVVAASPAAHWKDRGGF